MSINDSLELQFMIELVASRFDVSSAELFDLKDQSEAALKARNTCIALAHTFLEFCLDDVATYFDCGRVVVFQACQNVDVFRGKRFGGIEMAIVEMAVRALHKVNSPAKKQPTPKAETSAPSREMLDAVSQAIEAAYCPDREGPYGLYNYTNYKGEAPPHQVRDFRELGGQTYGFTVFGSYTQDDALDVYNRLTRDHIAIAAINAVNGT